MDGYTLGTEIPYSTNHGGPCWVVLAAREHGSQEHLERVLVHRGYIDGTVKPAGQLTVLKSDEIDPWVVWIRNKKTGAMFNGHYFNNIQEAVHCWLNWPASEWRT